MKLDGINWKRFALISAIAIFSSCGGGGGGDGSDSDLSQNACGTLGLNPKIISGTECANLDTSPVVRVVSTFSNGATALCTGTMITPSVVLTAVHCFIGENGQSNRLLSAQIAYGDDPDFTFVNVREILISSLLRVENVGGEEQLFNDFAILKLSKTVPLPTLPILASQAPIVGEVAQIFGYGRTQTGDSSVPSDNDGLFSGETEITLVTNNHIRVEFIKGGSGTCFGDSGGPLIVTVNGRPAIAGVLSAFVGFGNSTPDCSRGLTSQYTNLQSSELLNAILRAVPAAKTL